MGNMAISAAPKVEITLICIVYHLALWLSLHRPGTVHRKGTEQVFGNIIDATISYVLLSDSVSEEGSTTS